MTVRLKFDGLGVMEFLDAMRLHVSPEEWIIACREGRLRRRDVPVAPDMVLRSGDYLVHHLPATIEPAVANDIRILFEDDWLVVVNKPAPLPIHSCGRFHRNPLVFMLGLVYAPLKLRPVHRLDSDTSGVQVLAKTAPSARLVQPQFEQGLVRKKYVAKVHGAPVEDHFECRTPISREMGPGGVRVTASEGDSAHTEFRVLCRLPAGETLIEAIPHTGRTNQIRAHLWSLGLPIVGDPMYGAPEERSHRNPSMALRAVELRYEDP